VSAVAPARSPSALPPGSTLPPKRQTARWVVQPLTFLQELRAEHGDLFTVRMLYEEPWVMVGDPELIKQVFAAPADVLHAGESKRVLKPMLGGRSLLLLDGDAHMRQRRLLLPPFRGSHVARYEPVIRAVAEQAVAEWASGADGPEPAWPRMQTIALEVILRTVFGLSDGEHLDALRAAFGDLPVPGNAREGSSREFRAALARVDDLVYAEMDLARRDPRLADRDDVFALLLQARDEVDGTAMTDQEVRDELMTLAIAGHETAATTLAWALERLVRSPDALERAVAEADGGGGPYTDAVIQETLRLRPALPMVARLVKQPFELGGYELPPGVTIAPCPLLLHHREDLYPDPTAFRPERFLDRPPGTYTWIPFGGGVRRCIGAGFALLEMRVALATILLRARVGVPGGESEPEAMRRRAVTLRPARGARVLIEARA
jgi:cytochrome P450